MAGADPTRRLLRPLLDWDKSELGDFLEHTATPWLEDPSNASPDRTRNRIRLDILPLLRRENPSFTKTALQLWELARIDREYWDEATPVLPAPIREHFLESAELSAHQAKRLRLYKAILDAMGPGQALASHLLLLDRAWVRKIVGGPCSSPATRSPA